MVGQLDEDFAIESLAGDIFLLGNTSWRIRRIEAGVVRVGRGVDNDLVVANQRVSRYHAQLRWVESSWLVYDLDSTNGTWLDQERVWPSQPRALEPGSQLRLGDHQLEAHSGDAPPPVD